MRSEEARILANQQRAVSYRLSPFRDELRAHDRDESRRQKKWKAFFRANCSEAGGTLADGAAGIF